MPPIPFGRLYNIYSLFCALSTFPRRKSHSARMWALNKGDWPWLLLGFVGAVVAGGCAPSEGVFIAQVQVGIYATGLEH